MARRGERETGRVGGGKIQRSLQEPVAQARQSATSTGQIKATESEMASMGVNAGRVLGAPRTRSPTPSVLLGRALEREDVVCGVHDGRVGADRAALHLARVGHVEDGELALLAHRHILVALHRDALEANRRGLHAMLRQLRREWGASTARARTSKSCWKRTGSCSAMALTALKNLSDLQ